MSFILLSISPQHSFLPPDIAYIFFYIFSKSKDRVFFLIPSFHGNYVAHDNIYILQQTYDEIHNL